MHLKITKNGREAGFIINDGDIYLRGLCGNLVKDSRPMNEVVDSLTCEGCLIEQSAAIDTLDCKKLNGETYEKELLGV